MVDRCEVKKKGCVVVDLDGTLLNGNSTSLLVWFLSRHLLQKRKIRDWFSLVNIISKRLMRTIPHRVMKHKIIELSNIDLTNSDISKFATLLKDKTNVTVLKILKERLAQGNKILLATAAGDFFIPSYIETLGIGKIDFIASQFSTDSNQYLENKGELKLKAVRNYMKTHNLESCLIITDHEDDLPLLSNLSGEKILVNPSTKTLTRINGYLNRMDFKILKGY